MALSPKENYLRTLRGEVPEFVPSFFDPYMKGIREELLTPNNLPDGKPFTTSLGIEYVASPELNFGAMPKPGSIVIDDILKWRDQLKVRDVSNYDWEGVYKKAQEEIDRDNLCVCVDSGDYFLILVGLMGFEAAMLAVYEEPEEVKALLTRVSEFLLLVAKQQMRFLKPDIFILMDDDAAFNAPFFSLDTYREFFKPFHKMHCDLAMENGATVIRHDCGKSEQFVADWIEIGCKSWNPFQISNDCKAVKQKYGNQITLEGGWDSRPFSGDDFTKDELYAALDEYVATFAPGGRFTYSVMVGGYPAQGEEPNPKREWVKEYYEDKVRHYYGK